MVTIGTKDIFYNSLATMEKRKYMPKVVKDTCLLRFNQPKQEKCIAFEKYLLLTNIEIIKINILMFLQL